VELSGLSYAILRLANVYGPRQRSDLEGGVVSIFMDRLRQKQPVHIFGSGEQLRDFVYVKDVVSAVLACLRDRRSGLWNVGTGVPTSVNDLLTILAAALGPPVEVHHGPARPGDIFRSCLDINRIIGDGLWRPAYYLEDGIRDMQAVAAQR
jgi:UDP-glucose 4-epimerase